MRRKYIVWVIVLGIIGGMVWYGLAQNPPPLPGPLPPFTPNSVLTAAQLNALVDRMNAILDVITKGFNEAPQTINVDCNAGDSLGQTLQQAEAGDTIRISGTCPETVTVNRSGLTLDGQGSAILDGAGSSVPVVTVAGARGVTITNLTVQNGSLGILGLDGAAVRLLGVTVQNTTNEGIRVEQASAGFLSDCTVQASSLDGIAIVDTASAVLSGTITSTNNGNDGFRVVRNANASALAGTTIILQNNMGAGLFVGTSSHFEDFGSTTTVRNNQRGGVLVADASSATLHADISNNSGAGIVVQDSSSASLTNATINGNSNHGVLLLNACSCRMENTTISGNGFDGVGVESGCSATMRATTVTNNAAFGVSIEDARARIEASSIQNNLDPNSDIEVIFGARLLIDPATLGLTRVIGCDTTSLVRDVTTLASLSPCP